MNYFLLALATASAVVALLYSANIVRVALGQLRWGSAASFIGHIVLAPSAIALTIWLFNMAVAG